MLLKIENLHKSFGGLKAVSQFSAHLHQGEIVSIIGPNGAGKTTIFNLVTGFYLPDSGKIQFQAQDIAGLKPHLISSAGVSRTFQNIRLFGSLTVLDNIRLAFHGQSRYNLWQSLLANQSFHREEERITEKSLELLRIFELAKEQQKISRELPYGLQRRLEIARAIATNPKLLLLDEPAAGMNHTEVNDLMHLIRWTREKFTLTILLIEHQMRMIMSLSERIIVLNFGETIAEGKPEEVQKNLKVIEAYLGAQGHADRPKS